jgi:hypothetical protein
VAFLLAAALLTGCGDTRPARQPEGSVAFQTGNPADAAFEVPVVPGPPFRRPGILVPEHEQVWQPAWIDPDQQHPILQGATAGMTTGVAFVMMTPMALTFWPVAVGIMVGSTAMGMLGVTQAESTNIRMSAPDRTIIAEATKTLQPERLFRNSMERTLRGRTRDPLAVVAWHRSQRGEAAGSDPLADARARGLDGVLDCTIDAIGLAAGDERDLFGVFVRVRVRAFDVRDGQLRYHRILSYGPGQTVAGLPRADVHTLEFLAADRGRVYRQVAGDAIVRLARALAEDPALPLSP